MNKKVLVTGGAGFLGINLIRHLLHQGVTDIVSLDLAEFDYPEKDRVKIIKGDIRDKEAVREAMKGVQWVVHTAAALPLYMYGPVLYLARTTRSLLQAAFQLKPNDSSLKFSLGFPLQ